MKKIEQLDYALSEDLEILLLEEDEAFREAITLAQDSTLKAFSSSHGAKFVLFRNRKGKPYLRLQELGEVNHSGIVHDFYQETGREKDYEVLGGGDMKIRRIDNRIKLTFYGESTEFGKYKKEGKRSYKRLSL